MRAVAARTLPPRMRFRDSLFFYNTEPMLPFMAVCAKLRNAVYMLVSPKGLVPESDTHVVGVANRNVTDLAVDMLPIGFGNGNSATQDGPLLTRHALTGATVERHFLSLTLRRVPVHRRFAACTGSVCPHTFVKSRRVLGLLPLSPSQFQLGPSRDPAS